MGPPKGCYLTRALRLLGLTNYYPPAGRGGYAEICADVMRGLAVGGAEVRMLVGGPGAVPGLAPDAGSSDGVQVSRRLDYVLGAWRRPRAALRAVRNDSQVVREEIERGVDAALVWHMRGLVKAPLTLLHEHGIPVLYMLHDRWVLYERPGSIYVPWARLDALGARRVRDAAARAVSRGLELRFPPVEREGVACFVSEWLANEYTSRGWRPRHAEIVRCGVDVERLRAARAAPPAVPPRRLLFAGRIHPMKGLNVLIEALARTAPEVTLVVAGLEDDARHGEEMRRLAERLGVAGRVEWRGELPRAEVLRLLGECDALVYPSVEPEAYSLGLLEALGAGILVVTSAPGGPREYLEHGRNALVFPPGDVDALVSCLHELSKPDVARGLIAGMATTVPRISLDAVVGQVQGLIEAALREGSPRPLAPRL